MALIFCVQFCFFKEFVLRCRSFRFRTVLYWGTFNVLSMSSRSQSITSRNENDTNDCAIFSLKINGLNHFIGVVEVLAP